MALLSYVQGDNAVLYFVSDGMAMMNFYCIKTWAFYATSSHKSKKCMNTIFILSYSEFIGVTSLWSVMFTKSCTHTQRKKKRKQKKMEEKKRKKKTHPVYC